MPASLSTTFGSAPASMQQRREVVVRVDDGDHERGGAVGVDRVRDRHCAAISARPASSAFSRAAYISGVQLPSGSTDWPLRRRANVSGAERPFDVGAALEQQLHGVGVILGRGPDQRRLAVPLLAGVDVGAARRAAPSAAPAGPVRAAVIRIVSPSGSTAFGSAPASSSAWAVGDAAVDRRQLQRRHAVAVGRVARRRRRRAAGATSSLIVGAHRPVQRRRAVGLGGVDVVLLSQQRPHAVAVAVLDGVDERQRRGGLRTHAGARQQSDGDRARARTRARPDASEIRPGRCFRRTARAGCRTCPATPSQRLATGVHSRRHDEAVALHLAAGAADRGERQRIGRVRLAVAHAGAEDDQRMIEHRAVAFGRLRAASRRTPRTATRSAC